MEEKPDCTRSGVVYESICVICNPSCVEKGDLKKQESKAPSLYVGESSRSIQERAMEHWGAARKGDKKSHMFKHQCNEHAGNPPNFLFKIVSKHRTALGRQVKEAVRIRRRGGEMNILNSKSEHNRCHIPRLVIEEEDEETMKKRIEMEAAEEAEKLRDLRKGDQEWEKIKKRNLELLEAKRRRDSVELEGRKRSKKLRFERIQEDWGDIEEEEEQEVREEEQMVVDKCNKPPPSTCDQEGKG